MSVTAFRVILAAAFWVIVLPISVVHARDTHRCGSNLVVTGDSIAKLRQACGAPSRTVRLENDLGAAVGERWEYFVGEKAVLFTISGGRVTRIEVVL